MIIDKLIAQNFRNYKNLDLLFNRNKPINVIISPNGMGKSNLLELIYYFSYIRSFRNLYDKELIKKGNKSFFIECEYNNNQIDNKITIKYHKRKEIFINNKKVYKFSEVLGKLVTVLFCNEDIFIINGSPFIRRKFFDLLISTIDNKYLHYLRKYQELLKQKNFILKNKSNDDLLPVYNTQISQIILYIQKKRDEIITEINKIFQEVFSSIGLFDDKVKIVYSPSIKTSKDDHNEIIKFYNDNLNKELEYGFSIYGPHRDNYIFLINGIIFSKYASLGQTRLASIVLKFSQSEYYKKIFNIAPILLLDDVILELDTERQKRVLDKISDYQQMFITVTDKKYIKLFNNIDNINQIEIEKGQIKTGIRD